MCGIIKGATFLPIIISIFLYPGLIHADTPTSVCSAFPGIENPVIPPSASIGTPITIQVSFNKYKSPNKKYSIQISDNGALGPLGVGRDWAQSDYQPDTDPQPHSFTTKGGLSRIDTHDVLLFEDGSTSSCKLGTIPIIQTFPTEFKDCSIDMPDNIQAGTKAPQIKVHRPADTIAGTSYQYYFWITNQTVARGPSDDSVSGNSETLTTGDTTIDPSLLTVNNYLEKPDNYTAIIKAIHEAGPGQDSYGYICTTHTFSVTSDTTSGSTKSTGTTGGNISSNGTGSAQCDPSSKGCTSSRGISCDPANPGTAAAPNPGNGIYTAIGCVPTSIDQLVPAILRVALLAAGGIALLLMAIGALGMILSNGNPESLKNARARFTSAIIGLVFIIFSVLLLKIVGVDLLGLTAFGSN